MSSLTTLSRGNPPNNGKFNPLDSLLADQLACLNVPPSADLFNGVHRIFVLGIRVVLLLWQVGMLKPVQILGDMLQRDRDVECPREQEGEVGRGGERVRSV